LRHRLDEQGLGQPRHTDDEAVPTDKQCQQRLVDDLLLADDLLAQLDEDLLPPSLHAIGQGYVVWVVQVSRFLCE